MTQKLYLDGLAGMMRTFPGFDEEIHKSTQEVIQSFVDKSVRGWIGRAFLGTSDEGCYSTLVCGSGEVEFKVYQDRSIEVVTFYAVRAKGEPGYDGSCL